MGIALLPVDYSDLPTYQRPTSLLWLTMHPYRPKPSPTEKARTRKPVRPPRSPTKRIVLQAPGRQFRKEIRLSSKAWARVLTILRRKNPALAKKIDPTATRKIPRGSSLPDSGDYENWKFVSDHHALIIPCKDHRQTDDRVR